MSTFPQTWSTFGASSKDSLTLGELEYFRERLRNAVHEAVLRQFIKCADSGLTKALLAKRLGRKPEQITRWLGAPGNWTLETVSDLLLAMDCELEPSVVSLNNRPISNYAHDLVCSAALLVGRDTEDLDVVPLSVTTNTRALPRPSTSTSSISASDYA